jgi:hypothetical protein
MRCIASDLRRQRRPVVRTARIDRPWDPYTDDHLGLMDHLRINSSW